MSNKPARSHQIYIFSFQFNQDLYPSSAGVPLAASTSTSTSSHSPCSPALLPPSLSSTSNSAHSSSLTPSSLPLVGSLGQRHVTKEEDLTVPRTETEGELPSIHGATSSCSQVHRREIAKRSVASKFEKSKNARVSC